MRVPRDLTGVRADHRFSYRGLEKRAGCTREQLGLSPDEPIAALQFFEGLDDITIERMRGNPIPLRHGVISLEGSEGYTKYDSDRDMIEVLASEETYARLEQSHPRATYFVAHEFGHCLLHTEQLVRLAHMPAMQRAGFHRGRGEHKPYEDTEWQANAFASALLMPAVGLYALERELGLLTVEEVTAQFGVSNEAAGYRIELYRARRAELLRP